MMMTRCLRRFWEKKRWDNGSYYSHGLSRKLKTLRHRQERRGVRQALSQGLEEVPVYRPQSSWYF